MFKSSFIPETYALAIQSDQWLIVLEKRKERLTNVSRIQQSNKVSICCPGPNIGKYH